MTHLRRSLVAALTLFTAAITLDRTGFGAGSDVVGAQAYLIAAGAIAAPLLLTSLRRPRPTLAIITSCGGLLAYSAVAGAGFLGPLPVHVAAVELAFVALAAGLGHSLSKALDDLGTLLAATAVGESPAIDLEGPRAANEIHTELARSRRHDRPLSITVLTPTERGLQRALDQTALEADRAMRTRFLFGTLANTVSGVLRRSDLLFEHKPTGRLIVLSPETDATGTELLRERILAATASRGIETIAGIASFPGDGIGFETLIDEAERNLTRSSEPPQLRAVEPGASW